MKLKLLALFLIGVLQISCGSSSTTTSSADDTSSATETSSQASLTLDDTLAVASTSLWGVLSYNASLDRLYATLAQGNGIGFAQFDSNMEQIGSTESLTNQFDLSGLPAQIVDHKHIFLNNEIYVAFSLVGDTELYIFKTDLDGTATSSLVEVANSSSVPTNDPHLFTDGTTIYLIYGDAGASRTLNEFDTSLNLLSTTTLTLSSPHDQLGGTYYYNGTFYSFTGDATNQNLSVTQWDSDWNELENFSTTLIQGSETEFNYFGTGVIYDESKNVWYIAFHKLPNIDPENIGATRDQDIIYLGVFDSNFTEMSVTQISEAECFRPHMALNGSNLYLAYDCDGAGVTLKKFVIE